MINEIEELKQQRDIVNSIDWNMTPEKAIDMYLEWGAGWCRGTEFVKGNEESYYFVIYDWEKPASATLIKRNTKEVEELAKIPIDPYFINIARDRFGTKAGVGVYPLPEELKKWLTERLSVL